MKIAYLANVRIPSDRAHSAQIVHMCQAFSEIGHELKLYANTRTKGDIDAIAKQYNIMPAFKFARVSYGFFKPGWKWTFYLSELYYSLSVLKELKKCQYDIIFTRNEWTAWFVSLFISANKIVWESHEAKFNVPVKKIISKSIKIVAISEGVAEEYIKVGVPRGSVLVAHDGIDSSFFEQTENKVTVRQRLGLPQHKKIAMYIGGLDDWKGVDTFCEAGQLDDTTMWVVIGGEKTTLERFKAKYPKVHFLGPRPYSELSSNQQAGDILVIPNTAKKKLSSTYTSPLKLFAHMASGVPLIVSDVPSLLSVVGTNTVTTFKADTPQSLIEAIAVVKVSYEAKLQLAKDLKKQAEVFLWTERAKKIVNFSMLR